MAWIIGLTTISVVYGAFGAIRQKDLKYINAYSSVSHCGLVFVRVVDDERNGNQGYHPPNDFARIDDRSFL